MSDKSRDAEPSNDDVVPGEPEATNDEVEIDDPEALAEAEAEVMEVDETDDETIARLEEEFDDEPESVVVKEPREEGAIVRRTSKAPVRKGAPTKKRSDAVAEPDDQYKASNPIEFARQSGSELKKVVWPTWPQLVTMFVAVLVFVLIIIAIVGVLDLAFGWTLLKLFGA